MGRFLTLLTLLILGAMAQPSPLLTRDSPNGLWWRGMTTSEKVDFMAGANEGGISTTLDLITALYFDEACQSRVRVITANQARQNTKYTNADLLREMGAFYNDGANISLPAYTALRYVRMKLTGATKQELDSFLKEVK